jgi:Protein of unknown function (DUF3147)
MRIKINFAAAKETKPHEYAIRFLFGGLITVATGLIAKKFGPTVGGLFLAFPAIFPATTTLVATHEKEEKRRSHLNGTPRGRDAAAIEARGTALGSLGLLAFAAVVAGELRSSAIRPAIQQSCIKGHPLPNHNAPAVLLAAAAAWFATSVLFWRLRELIRRP